MKRFTGLLNRNKASNSDLHLANAPADSPQAAIVRAISTFCESGTPSDGGDEVLHLPVIVEAAESSDVAAAAAAQRLGQFLGKEYNTKPQVQYNSVMLIRILSDNPGASFMRNFDKPFVSNVKQCLRACKELGTQQILRETLDWLEFNKSHEDALQPLLLMWRKEKGHSAVLTGRNGSGWDLRPRPPGAQGQGQGPGGRISQLPTPPELASRVEEAKNTAKILLQLIQSTPTPEVLQDDLIREFGERCQMALKSMQAYINCQNPAPDDDTMQTLIETNEQLSLASSRYHRALLTARRATSPASPPVDQQTPLINLEQPQPPQQPASLFASVSQAPKPFHNPQPTNGSVENSRPVEMYVPPTGPPQVPTAPGGAEPENPFADPLSDHLQDSLFNSPSGATFNPSEEQRHTRDLENVYATDPPRLQTQHEPADDAYNASPVRPTHSSDGYSASPPRPSLGPYHEGSTTASYVGRQDSALRGLTMHGAQPEQDKAK